MLPCFPLLFLSLSWRQFAHLTGYVHTLSALRDPDCEVNNEDNVERTIQFGDQASFDLQELWNLVEGNFSSTQNVDSQGL